MRHYPPNSPEAIARILAMFMISDGEMEEPELELLERLNVYQLIKLPRRQFAEVLINYCDDISDEAGEDGAIHMLERELVDSLLLDITDQPKRMLTCVLAMDISKSDGSISDAEMALLRYMMHQWHITLDDLEREFSR